MTIPLFLLWWVHIGLLIGEFDWRTIGTVNDMGVELKK